MERIRTAAIRRAAASQMFSVQRALLKKRSRQREKASSEARMEMAVESLPEPKRGIHALAGPAAEVAAAAAARAKRKAAIGSGAVASAFGSSETAAGAEAALTCQIVDAAAPAAAEAEWDMVPGISAPGVATAEAHREGLGGSCVAAAPAVSVPEAEACSRDAAAGPASEETAAAEASTGLGRGSTKSGAGETAAAAGCVPEAAIRAAAAEKPCVGAARGQPGAADGSGQAEVSSGGVSEAAEAPLEGVPYGISSLWRERQEAGGGSPAAGEGGEGGREFGGSESTDWPTRQLALEAALESAVADTDRGRASGAAAADSTATAAADHAIGDLELAKAGDLREGEESSNEEARGTDKLMGKRQQGSFPFTVTLPPSSIVIGGRGWEVKPWPAPPPPLPPPLPLPAPHQRRPGVGIEHVFEVYAESCNSLPQARAPSAQWEGKDALCPEETVAYR